MVENRQPLVMPDTLDFPAWIFHPETTWVRSYVGAPIVQQEQVIGFINLDSPTPNLYNARTAERLMSVANHVAIAIQNARLFEQLQELAVTDELTGIDNRRGFFALANREFERALRYQHPLTVLVMDIDHFKDVNDRLGHPAGDEVLRRIAQECVQEIRKIDLLGRYGGEEFVFALTETTLEQAHQTAERIRARIGALVTETPAGSSQVTVSLGVAELCPKCRSLQNLIDHADQALYEAKQAGRNRVEVYCGE
jgi:diguanylate cyclase (GGDEF)-like protein